MAKDTKDNFRKLYDEGGKLRGYKAIIRITTPTGRKINKYKSFLFKNGHTKQHAKTWRMNKLRELIEEDQNPAKVENELLVSQMMVEFCDGPAKKHADGGARAMRVAKQVNRLMGDKTIADLTPEAIIDYAIYRLEMDGREAATIRKELSFTKQAFVLFRYVHKFEKENPFEAANELIKLKKVLPIDYKNDIRCTAEEFENILMYKFKVYKLMPLLIEFAALEGLRAGEISRMRREHLTGDILSVPITKTNKPRRFALFPRSLEILKSLPIRIDGTFWGMTPREISTTFSNVKYKLGYNHLTFHITTRHEACSRMADMKMSMLDIQAKSGHADMNMLKRYVHMLHTDEAREYALTMAGLKTSNELRRFGISA